jgi:hypothetical protein
MVWTGTELFVGGGGRCVDGVAETDPPGDAHLLDINSGVWRSAVSAPVTFYSPFRYADTWTGTSVAVLAPDGTILLYNPAKDLWHQSSVLAGHEGLGQTMTPIAAFGDSIIVADGARIDPCCLLASGGVFAYAIPADF